MSVCGFLRDLIVQRRVVARPATAILIALLCAAACSEGSATAPSPSPGPSPSPAPAPAPPPSPPVITFGPGQHLIGSGIQAGRYYSDPASGCYWERQSGAGATAADTIAFTLVSF